MRSQRRHWSSRMERGPRPKRMTLQLEVLEDRTAPAGGPLVLMGIDAEDGGPNGHGPITTYRTVVASILHSTTNGGSDILVLGGGKSQTDNVTQFWKAIDGLITQRVRFANGEAIKTVPFTGKAMIAIVSDVNNTPGGGLTNEENGYLADRRLDIANFLDRGGGLLGFSSVGLIEPYPYLREVGSFTFNGPGPFANITPTREGVDIGVTNLLDVCCWHDEFLTFPSFLDVLATRARSETAVAVGGRLATGIGGDAGGWYDARVGIAVQLSRPENGNGHSDPSPLAESSRVDEPRGQITEDLGNDGAASLHYVTAATVSGDGASDTLTGKVRRDWFVAHVSGPMNDTIRDVKANEFGDAIAIVSIVEGGSP